MLRRILLISGIVLLIGVVTTFIIIRQIVFGGTPTIHRTLVTSTPQVGTPCATSSPSNNLRAFKVDTQNSSASYEAHFQAAGVTVPGTVTGVTGDVSGEFLLSSDTQLTIVSMKIQVDLRTLDSGQPERDDHVRNDTLEVNTYPFATFVVMNLQIVPGTYVEGQMVTFKLKGNLTLHGVTRPVAFDAQSQLTGNTVSGTATTLIHLPDYKMRTPTTTAVVPIAVSKDITLTLQFSAQRENCS